LTTDETAIPEIDQEGSPEYQKLHTAAITIPKGFWRRVKKAALEEGISASELVRKAVRAYMRSHHTPVQSLGYGIPVSRGVDNLG
jgi:hypothetical protein